MPVHPIEPRTSRSRLADSLSDELNTFKERARASSLAQENRYSSQVLRNHLYDDQDRRNKPVQNSSNVSSTVFGYDINYDRFKKESYFSKLLSDRLDPFLSKTLDGRIPKHRSFTINNPVPIYYE